MVTVLLFSLVIVHNSLIRRDLRDYSCHVGSAPEAPGCVRNLDVFLQAPGIAETKGKLSRNHKVTTLECFSDQSSVQVNLLHLEKMHGDLTKQRVEKCTLQSLEVITTAVRVPGSNHTCVLTSKRWKFQRRLILRGKVFLAEIPNHATTPTLLEQRAFSNGTTTLHAHQENQTSQERNPPTNDKDLLIPQNLTIALEVLTACILLASTTYLIMSLIYETLALCSCPAWIVNRWRSSRNMSPASVLAAHQSGTLPIPLLQDTKEKSVQYSA